MAPLSTKFSNLLVVVLAVPAILLALDADINVAAAPFNRMQRRSAFLAEDSVLQARAGGPKGGDSSQGGYNGGGQGGHGGGGSGYGGSGGGREHHPHNHHDGQGHREGHPHNNHHNHDGQGMHSSEVQEPTKREFLEHEMNLIQRDPNGLAEGIKGAAHIAIKHYHHHDFHEGGSNQNQRREEHSGKVGKVGKVGEGSRGGRGGRGRPGEGGRGVRVDEGDRGSRGGEGGRGRPGEGGRGGEGSRRKGEGRGGRSDQPYRRALTQPPNGGTKDHINPSANPVGAHAATNEVPGQTNHRTHSQLEDLGQETPDNHRTPHSQSDREALNHQTSDRYSTHHQPGGHEEIPANHRTAHSQLDHEALDQETPNHRKKLGVHKKPAHHRVHLSQHHRHSSPQQQQQQQQQKELHPQDRGSSKSGDLSGGKSFAEVPPKQGALSGGKNSIPSKQGAPQQDDSRSGTLPPTSQHDGPKQANLNAATGPHRRSYFDLEDLD